MDNPIAGAAPSVGSAPATQSRRILVVDDNVDAASTLALLLQSAGHTVRTEHSAHAGLAAAGREDFEVILLDIGLPDMSGHELAKALKKQPRSAAALLVAVSGYAAHLVKPVVAEELLATIAGAADGHAALP